MCCTYKPIILCLGPPFALITKYSIIILQQQYFFMIYCASVALEASLKQPVEESMIRERVSLILIVLAANFVRPTVYAATAALITGAVETDFGVYSPVVGITTPSVAPYEIHSDLGNVTNIGSFDLSGDTRALLAANGFAAVASSFRKISDGYNESKDRSVPVFVTTDACLHSYHILYDYVLRAIETDYFADDIESLTRALIADMQKQYEEATASSVKVAALDTIAYLSVALKLVDPEAQVDVRVVDVVQEEVAAILALSDGYTPSPLFYSEDYPYEEDYSQYKPRGHYTRNETLERYFRAMMWYGRMTFSLDLTGATQDGIRKAAVQALLLSRSMDKASIMAGAGQTAEQLWRRIYEPTVFFVGKADDITFDTYLDIAKNTFGTSFTTLTPDILADDGKIDQFIASALLLPEPSITTKTGNGLRLMGQRFIPDSYILDQCVEEFVRDRLMPRGLDVMSVLGSARAREIVAEYYKDPERYGDYIPKINALTEEFRGYTPAVWAQNLYFNWLYTISPLLEPKGEGYPLFMQTEAWTDKSLATALGSWAELRHDTILYAKQSETFETSMPSQPKLVKGYVEPEPEVFGRLAALAAFTRDGLENRGLLDETFDTRLKDFEKLMLALRAIAVKELENATPSDAEYALICNFGPAIEEMTSFPPEFSAQYENEADSFMAVIADIHTDPNTNSVLEVGVGHPLDIYVIAPIEGVLTLTRGAIFSYHEFTRSLTEGRLTDEEWQKLQNGANAVSMPEWTESFLAGPSSTGSEPWSFTSRTAPVTSVEDEKNELPAAFSLLQNSPNPFNPSTTISYRLSGSGHVLLAVFNGAGQRIATLVDGPQEAGIHTIVWKPDNLASGVYLIKLTIGNATSTIRTVFLK